MLQFLGVGKCFGPDWVLVRYSLEVRPGELVWLDGPAGAGKSLLVRMALGAVRPTSGSVIVNDLNPAKLGYRERQRWRRGIGAVQADEPALDMPALSWLALGSVCSGNSWPVSITQAGAALERLSLADLARRSCLALSSRQRFALSLARALARRPHLLLMDWPGAAFAGQSAELSLELKRYIEQGGACLAVGQVQTEIGGRQENIPSRGEGHS